MTDAKTPDNGWWSADRTIAWIAFRQAITWQEFYDLPENRNTRSWGGSSGELLAAFEARARGEAWRPAKVPPNGARYYRATVRRIMRETGEPAGGLAEDLRRDLARDAEAHARERQAMDALRDALGKKLFKGRGLATPQFGAPASQHTISKIPAKNFVGSYPLTIQRNGWTYPPLIAFRFRGRWWQGVCFKVSDVRKVWPERPAGGRIAEANRWMLKNAAGRKRDDAVLSCRTETGCTDAVARTAWNALPTSVKGAPGKRKAST